MASYEYNTINSYSAKVYTNWVAPQYTHNPIQSHMTDIITGLNLHILHMQNNAELSVADLFKNEMVSLSHADCVIIDITNPTLYIGMLIGYVYSGNPKIPILALTCDDIASVDDMVAGCPSVTILKYSADQLDTCKSIIQKWLYNSHIQLPKPQGPIIMIDGHTSIGKTTTAKYLANILNIPYISSSTYIATYHTRVELCSETARKFLYERFSNPDCQHGYILDGFLNNKDCFNMIRQLGINPDCCIYLAADDTTIKSRLHLTFSNDQIRDQIHFKYQFTFPDGIETVKQWFLPPQTPQTPYITEISVSETDTVNHVIDRILTVTADNIRM